MKYRLIDEETLGQMIDFLDTIQIEASKGKYKDDMDKINMCSYFISEIINSDEAFDVDEDEEIDNLKSNDDIVVGMPEMNEKDWNKMLEQLDSFFEGWQKAYKKKNKKRNKKRDHQPEDLVDDEINKMAPKEKFELYYAKRRSEKQLKESKSLNKMLKDLGIELSNIDKK